LGGLMIGAGFIEVVQKYSIAFNTICIFLSVLVFFGVYKSKVKNNEDKIASNIKKAMFGKNPMNIFLDAIGTAKKSSFVFLFLIILFLTVGFLLKKGLI
jgi:hypothetical protein